jgi:hypothetical protein
MVSALTPEKGEKNTNKMSAFFEISFLLKLQ